MAHRDAIVHCDGVELLADTASPLDLFDHQSSHILQVYVARHELSKGVGDRDDGFLEITILHTGGAPKGAGSGHIASGGAGAGTIDRHAGSIPCVR